MSIAEEACPHNLAPTASTTATLAMGDALAVAVLEALGFSEQDFARSYPGGSLGRKLLLHVDDVMRTGDQLPVVSKEHTDDVHTQRVAELERTIADYATHCAAWPRARCSCSA